MMNTLPGPTMLLPVIAVVASIVAGPAVLAQSAFQSSSLYQRDGLEFEDVPGRSDIRVSKPFITPGGDKVRAVFAVDDTVIVLPLGERRSVLTSLTLGGAEDGVAYSAAELGKAWDVAASIAIEAANQIIGGFFGDGNDDGDGGGGDGADGDGGDSCDVSADGNQIDSGGGDININIEINIQCSQ